MTPQALAAASAALRTPDTLTGICGREPGTACRLVWDVTNNGTATRLTKVYLAGPVTVALRIAFVLVLALAIRAVTHRIIRRITDRAGSGGSDGGRALLPERTGERRLQRSQALRTILGNASSIVIFGIAGIIILGDLGVNLAPILASAGVLGVALGFGAQSLVGDFLAGISILLEDQYGVGDVINTTVTTGTVEAVGLRVTRLRDVNGVVWHVRNGSVQQVGNQSQGWARAVIDFPVPYNQDMSEIREIMTQVATTMWREPRWDGVILEEPKVWGVQSLSSSEAVWRLVAMTTPPRQYEVERELRERIKVELDARGIATAPTLFTLTGTDAQAGAVLTTAASQAPDEGSPGAESGDGELDDGG
ncbi:MAG TPA: mechanosensitive ion channel family protein [Streptosporangiaceae bacterium]